MFLYLFEDDNFRQSCEAPTEHDRTCVAAGILAVFRYTTGNGYERLFNAFLDIAGSVFVLRQETPEILCLSETVIRIVDEQTAIRFSCFETDLATFTCRHRNSVL